MDDGLCGSCRWFLVDPVDETVGECFHGPPVVLSKGMDLDDSRHPMTRYTDFCSHHEERREPLPPVDLGVASDVASLGEAAEGMVGGTE
jgi:hypothetical protein